MLELKNFKNEKPLLRNETILFYIRNKNYVEVGCKIGDEEYIDLEGVDESSLFLDDIDEIYWIYLHELSELFRFALKEKEEK
jgi:hypothetical protein